MEEALLPTPKVAAGGIAGAITILIVAALAAFGIVLDPVAASALSTLIAFGAAWLKREKGIDLDGTDIQ